MSAPEVIPETRTEKILFHVRRGDKVLELGPSFSPLVPRSAGWNSYSLDHLSAADLKKKYEAHAVDASRIEEVDFVWRDGPLEASVPTEHHGTFDACVASHVIEHAPDLVAFLTSMRVLLKDTGRLCLAIPDKRYSFDYFMPPTTTGDVLEAHAAGRTRHSKKAAFNATAYASKVDGAIAWAPGPLGKLELVSSLAAAQATFALHGDRPDAPYADLHGMCFTPASFELVVLELAHLGLADFHVQGRFPTAGCEFFVTLAPGKRLAESETILSEWRLSLLRRTLLELREQTDPLVAQLGADPSR